MARYSRSGRHAAQQAPALGFTLLPPSGSARLIQSRRCRLQSAILYGCQRLQAYGIVLSVRHAEVADRLRAELQRAESQYKLSQAEFSFVLSDIPSGLPQPDGTQRIHNAARDYHTSREAFQTALDRFNDFILRGKIPGRPRRQPTVTLASG